MDILSPTKLKQISTSRLSPGIHQGIVIKVRNFYRKSSPYGCSQNVKAEVRDIDKAVEANRLREQRVDEFAESELKKLHFFKINQRYTGKSPISKSKSPKTVRKLNFSVLRPQCTEFVTITKFSETQNIKRPDIQRTSTSVSPERQIIQSFRNENKLKRLASLDAIIKSCDELKPKLKPDIVLIENRQQELVNSTQSIKNFIDEAEDVANMTKRNKNTKGIIKKSKNSRKSNVCFCNEGAIKDEMLAVTRKLVQLGGNKIWRHNHVEFMASVEKIIN
ncbi:hypothetical protein SteCoe_15786 [Stentor coeruleus]|uniref:Uncharacterized protein n=1 Tax=Stentor coeruleus TaxID=5963 RepID=A0A1R2C2Q9_9CILI|nr:hypothetical protein SteCoe_15786 [Stentor coeruleus]